MTESKRPEPTPYVDAEPKTILEALDMHGKGMPMVSAAIAPLRARTTIIERQNSWNNRHDAARDLGLPTGARPDTGHHKTPLAARTEATSVVGKTARSVSVWPVELEPADRDAVAVWRNEGDPN